MMKSKTSPDQSSKVRTLLLLLTISISLYNCKIKTKNISQTTEQNTNSTSGTSFLGSSAYMVPHDVNDSTQVALCNFAWKEFIALNWPSTYNTTTHERGKPDTSKTVADFLNVSNTGQLVWQTYKHRVELYPRDTTTFSKTFNDVPQYNYDIDGQATISPLNSSLPSDLKNLDSIFNNLDETSEINLCTLFVDGDPDAPGASDYPNAEIASGLPGAPRRMIYEAKGNEDMFNYILDNHLYDSITRAKKIGITLNEIKNNKGGAVYPCPNDEMICFPFGEIGGVEGSIEVKATWKPLTLSEYNSGRYLTSPIIYYREGVPGQTSDGKAYYDVIPATPTYNNGTLVSLPYGLVGLHIIHKTKNFPSYVFATFEQVDNLNDNLPHNNLFYYNRNSNPSVSAGKQYAYRANALLEDTKKVNDTVHSQITNLNPNSIWQYYKLIGVQGHPQNNANTTDYFLSNVMTETNQTLRDFSGTLNNDTGTFNPQAINLYQGDKVFVQGGCKGCHGNAQQSDFSFITQNAPFKGEPDVINQPLLKGPND